MHSQRLLRIARSDLQGAIERTEELRRSSRHHANPRSLPHTVEIRREGIGPGRAQRQHTVHRQSHAAHFSHIVNGGCRANPGCIQGTVIRVQRGRRDRRHGGRLRRDDAERIGAPVGHGHPIVGARQQLLQQRTAAARGAPSKKTKILVRHKRPGSNLSILSACDLRKIQLRASISFAPMEMESCA